MAAPRYNDPFDLLRRVARCPFCDQVNRCYIDDPRARPVCGRCGKDLMAHERTTIADTCVELLRHDSRGFPLPPPRPPNWLRRLRAELGQLVVHGRFRTRGERAVERDRYAAAALAHRALCDRRQQELDRQTRAAERERQQRLAEETDRRLAAEGAERERAAREMAERRAREAREEAARREQEAREAAQRCAAEAERLYGELANLRYLTGLQFESFLASVFRAVGCGAQVTKASGDFGVDVIVNARSGERVAVQAKNIGGQVNNTDVQKLYAGMRIHGCSRCLLVCTSAKYSKSARKAARHLGVLLWDVDDLRRVLRGGQAAVLGKLDTV